MNKKFLTLIKLSYEVDIEASIIHNFPHPWGFNKAIGIILPETKIILKRKNNLTNLKNEIEILSFLEKINFGNIEKIIKTKDNKYFINIENHTWMVYQWFTGYHIQDDSLNDAKLLGIILANFHIRTLPLTTQIVRADVQNFNKLFFQISNINGLGIDIKNLIKEFFDKQVFSIEWHLRSLPMCIIHGDFNLENIIKRSDQFCLIDFEFSRYASRITDLVSFFIKRDIKSGNFILCKELFIKSFLESYMTHIEYILPMTDIEKNLLNIYLLLHIIKIYCDIYYVEPQASLCIKFLEKLLHDNWLNKILI